MRIEDLIKKIEEVVVEDEPRLGFYHASTLTWCPKKQMLNRLGLGVKRAVRGRDRRISEVGIGFHERLAMYLFQLDDMGELELLGVELESVNMELRLLGTLDALVRLDDGVWVIEGKTANEAGFMKFRGGNIGKQYRIQAAAYLLLRPEAEGVLWIAENKNTQELVGVRGVRSSLKNEIEEVYELCSKMEGLIREGKLWDVGVCSKRSCEFYEICSFLKTVEDVNERLRVLRGVSEDGIVDNVDKVSEDIGEVRLSDLGGVKSEILESRGLEVREEGKEVKPKKRYNEENLRLFNVFRDKYREVVGVEYVPSWGRDMKIVNDLKVMVGIEEVEKRIERYFQSDRGRRLGYSLVGFRLVFNELVDGGERKKVEGSIEGVGVELDEEVKRRVEELRRRKLEE